MAPTSFTQGWDILVSYASEEKLNGLLKNAWAIPLGTNELEYSGDALGFRIKLVKPWLEFKTNDNKATLHVELHGTYWDNVLGDSRDDPFKFEDLGYSLSITAPIGVVEGDQTVHIGDNTFRFDDGKTKEFAIVLHMQNQQLEWKSNPPTSQPNGQRAKEADVLAKQSLKMVESHIRNPRHIRWLDIKLGEVNNKSNENSPLKDLFKPVSFKLATRKNALDIFIQTKSGHQQGNAHPRFDVDKSPLKNSKYNGAIILSHRLFQDKYLVPQIQKHCPSLVQGTGVAAKSIDSGYKLELAFDEKKVIGDGIAEGPHFAKIRVEKREIDFKKYPVILNIIDKKNALPQASWEWDHKIDVVYTEELSSPDYPIPAQTYTVKVRAKIKDNHSDIAKLDHNKLNFSFQFKNDDQPEVDYSNAKDLNGRVKVNLDVFKFALDELHYFATTNVFAPGMHFIDLETVRAPHDLFVMGQIKSRLN